MALPVRKSGKSGGGYLNGVNGVIESITFKQNKTGESKGKTWTKYSGVVTIVADGASKSVPQFLDAGFLPDGCSISDDLTTIEGGKYYLDGDSNFGKFIVSFVEGDGNRLDADVLGDCRNYASIGGTRVTFRRELDVEGTIEAGLRKLKLKTVTDENREKVIDAGKRVAKKDGKELKGDDGKTLKFMLDQLLIGEVLAAPEAGKAPAKKAAAPKAAAKPAAKAAPVAAETEFDLDEADDLVKLALDGTEGVTRNVLGSAFVKASLTKAHLKTDSKLRESLRKFVISDGYLDGAVERAVVILDGEGKDERIQLVA